MPFVTENVNAKYPGVKKVTSPTLTEGTPAKWENDNVEAIVNALETKQDVLQKTTLPTASFDNLNTVIQYVGESTANLTNGMFYKCVSNNNVYEWQVLQTSPTLNSYFRYSNGTPAQDSDMHSAYQSTDTVMGFCFTTSPTAPLSRVAYTWVNIKGPKGDTGDTGPQGQIGNTGATGEMGPTGITSWTDLSFDSMINGDLSLSGNIVMADGYRYYSSSTSFTRITLSKETNCDTSSIMFKTGRLTTVTYPADWKFYGDDCVDGVYTAVINKTYYIIIEATPFGVIGTVNRL